MAAGIHVIVRPGNGLLEWGGMCMFHGAPDKISGYKLGLYIELQVVVSWRARCAERRIRSQRRQPGRVQGPFEEAPKDGRVGGEGGDHAPGGERFFG